MIRRQYPLEDMADHNKQGIGLIFVNAPHPFFDRLQKLTGFTILAQAFSPTCKLCLNRRRAVAFK